VNGPTNLFCQDLHATKYRGTGEDFREAMQRVASPLADDEPHYRALRDVLLDMRFLAAGRIQAAIGSPRVVTPYNCFVSPRFEDTLVETTDPLGLDLSIMDMAKYAANTMRMGGGIGYDFSTLRPRGDRILKLDSYSSGPVSFMEIFNAVCLTISSSGHRRGAQMGVLRVDHPDIEEFILAKQNHDKLTGFNISVAVTDEFMMAVLQDNGFDLRFGGKVYRTVSARALWQKIMRSAWDWAEPGVIFIDRVNKMNNLSYCETIAATNPCGEQPLPPNGACLLGSFNLVKYLDQRTYTIDQDRLIADIPHVVRAMDNVVDAAVYPHRSQEIEAKSKRRMGLGVTGVANAIEAEGYDYGTPGFCQRLDAILQIITNKCYQASAQLSAEKGCFPVYQRSMFMESEFVKTLWPETLSMMDKHGMRNSHLTSIAPTGTISLCADNVSSGIEPVFAHSYTRTVNMPDGQREVEVVDYGVDKLGVKGRIASEVSIEEHIRVLTTAQRRVDSAVSKTCNVSPDTPWDDFCNLYVEAWKGGAKGCTAFQIGGKRFGILNAQEDGTKEAAQCRIDSETGRRECE
jgi:ribonucleoside-diphosphate reductase alpha chain